MGNVTPQRMSNWVAEWLSGLETVVDDSTEPVIVTVGTQTWSGAIYESKVDGAEAVGRKRIYIVGQLPKSYLRSSRTLYVEKSGQVWYFGGWYDADATNRPSWFDADWKTKWEPVYHPFGSNGQFHQQTADGFPPLADWYRGNIVDRPTRQLRITKV